MADPGMKKLARCSDEELLSLRFKDLGLRSTGPLVRRAVNELYRDLARRGIAFRPHVWLSDEFFCPDGVPGFAVPFYLAHSRLMRLERRKMLEIEGGTLRSCLRILRHETGHALDNAFRLRRRKERQRLFGSSEVPYPSSYAPRPFSRRFVRHLELGYAQAHPDEDFAETFAVWLDPASDWRRRYASWPALEKLEYMDRVIGEVSRRRPALSNRRRPYDVTGMERSLRLHYRIRRERYRVDFSENYDSDLSRLFGVKGEERADRFLRRRRSSLRRQVTRWTGIPGYTVDAVLRGWIERSRERKLTLRRTPERTQGEVVTALTVRVMQYLQSGNYRVVV
jgi:hypothetical protein